MEVVRMAPNLYISKAAAENQRRDEVEIVKYSSYDT